MRGPESAYAVLGLRPGALRSEVDEAYRRLIKLHHPDRNGGDGSRAAEINHAYTLIRSTFPQPARYRSVPVAAYVQRRGRVRRRPFWLFVLVVGVGIGAIAAQDSRGISAASRQVLPMDWDEPPRGSRPAAIPAFGSFEGPLYGKIIDSAISHAIDFHSAGDLTGAVGYSRDCHNRLRADPNLVLFDACAAFDESALTLGGRGASMDDGPFSGSAVMSREMAAARAISDDMLSADSRLHQIRARVEMALLPRLDAAAGQPRP